MFLVVALVNVTLSGVRGLPRATPAKGPLGRQLPRHAQVSRLCPTARAGTGPPGSQCPYLQNMVTPGLVDSREVAPVVPGDFKP